MSGFTPTVKFETDFDGDHLTFELRRLKIKHHALILRIAEKDSSLSDRVALLLDTGKAILPDCVVSIQGLVISDIPNVDINFILDEAYFLPLIDILLTQLVQISRVESTDIKN